jgi:hypothetical protein
MKTFLAIVSSVIFGASLFAQTAMGPSPLDLAGGSTQSAPVYAGTVAPLQITLDPTATGGDTLDVAIHDPSIVISLVRPDGVVVTAANAASLGYTFVTALADGSVISLPLGSFTAAGPHVVIGFGSAQSPGVYTIRADGTALASDNFVSVAYYSSSNVKAGAATGSLSYTLGDTVALSGLLYDGTSPILNATVTAQVFAPTILTSQVSLSNYVLISRTSPDSFTTQYEYSVTITNNGAAQQAVSGTASSADASVQFVRSSVYFGDLAAGATLTSNGTFIVTTPVGANKVGCRISLGLLS